MAIGKMWPKKDLVELRVIFQDLEDIGYTCYFREVNNIQIYSKHWDGVSAEPGVMDYNEICDSLVESIDRLKDIYDIDSIYFNLGLSHNTDWKSVRYDYPPDSLDLTWIPKSGFDIHRFQLLMHESPEYKLYGISIHTSPKKIFGKIKNFLGFNESLNNDII